MKITQLIELLESTRESHGELDVRAGESNTALSESRAITGIWVVTDPVKGAPYLKLAIPRRGGGW